MTRYVVAGERPPPINLDQERFEKPRLRALSLRPLWLPSGNGWPGVDAALMPFGVLAQYGSVFHYVGRERVI